MPRPRRNDETTAAMARVDAPQMWANRRNQMTSYARPVAPDANKSAVAAANPRTLPNPRLHVDQSRMTLDRRIFPPSVSKYSELWIRELRLMSALEGGPSVCVLCPVSRVLGPG